jgi:putative ABC transport system permease protein
LGRQAISNYNTMQRIGGGSRAGWPGGLGQDLRYATRVLARSPGFTVVVVSTLALTIGANTAVFSLVNAALVRPLPYPEADRLVVVWETDRKRGLERNAVAPLNYLDCKEQNHVFEEMAALEIGEGYNLTGAGEPERITGARVTASLFGVLGVNAHLGRTFSEEEDRRGPPRVVLLSYSLWQRRFGGSADIIGRPVRIDDRAHTVVGVMPAGFRFPERIAVRARSARAPDVWVPMAFFDNERRMRGNHYLGVVARLKRGASIEQAEAELDAIAMRIAEANPAVSTGDGVSIVPMHDQLVGESRPALLLLLGAVGFVLLIASSNIANLLLSRSALRQKEVAIRTALGAGRLRLARQLLTESGLLAVLGGALGVVAGLWAVRRIPGFAGGNLMLPDSGAAAVDPLILGFSLGVTLLAGVVFSIAPVVSVLQGNFAEPLKEGGRSAAGSSRWSRSRSLFVVSQVALAVVLLAGAGLMIRTLVRLLGEDPGFRTENLLTVKMFLPGTKYPGDAERFSFYRNLLDRVQGLPGVSSAGAISILPIDGGSLPYNFIIEGRPSPPPGGEPGAQVRAVTPSYFATMGIPLRSGRTLTERDTRDKPPVVVINEAMARRYWPGGNPIGEYVALANAALSRKLQIVGVAGDVKQFGLAASPEPEMYISYFQEPRRFINLVVRSTVDPSSLAGAIRGEIKAVDPEQPVFDIRTMEQVLADSIQRRWIIMLLLVAFAVSALILSALGVYGVLSSFVNQRQGELGIRMALGATQNGVRRLVIREGLTPVLAGVAIGLAAALALTRLMSSLLYGVSAADPVTMLAVSGVLTAVALLASYIPARRATKVDPMVALRYE